MTASVQIPSSAPGPRQWTGKTLRRWRLAVVTLAVGGSLITTLCAWTLRDGLFPSAIQRARTGFAACAFRDAEGCADLLPAYLDGCEQEIAAQCHDAALMYHEGRATRRDDGRALALMRRGCELRDGPSCNAVGRMLRQGIGGAVDDAGALVAYQAACALRQGEACQRVGLAAAAQPPTDKNLHRAEAFLGLACKNSVALACYNYLIIRARVDRNAEFAEAAIQKLCDVEALVCKVEELPLHQPNMALGAEDQILSDTCTKCRLPMQHAQNLGLSTDIHSTDVEPLRSDSPARAE